MRNTILGEDIVQTRTVDTQTVDFTDFCLRLAHGSTVTAADVSAVMQQIEDKLPEILSLNAKVICSPSGLTFRPKVSGCITKSELKAKLEARKAAETDPEKAAKIDVNRELRTSDLTTSDCTVSVEVTLPKDWNKALNSRSILKRVGKSTDEESEDTENPNSTNPGGTNNGSTTPSNPSDPSNPGNGGDNGGGDDSGSGFDEG